MIGGGFLIRTVFSIAGIVIISLIPSSLLADNAPVTTAASIVNAVPGTSAVPVPVTVTGFSDIGKLTLTLNFDLTRVQYVSSSVNPSLAGLTVNYSQSGGIGKLILAWTGATNHSLTDGSSLADLVFSYTSGTGIIGWDYNFGSVCQYKRYVGGTLVALTDTARYIFYKNGGISNRGAPVTSVPVITVSAPGAVPVAITATGFTGISAMSLNLEFDPSVITYQNSYVKNPAFGSSFSVGTEVVFGGRMRLKINWFGNATTLATGATICTLNFNCPATGFAPSTLNWFDNIESCEYADGAGDVLIDLPYSTYYLNGGITPPLVADFAADKLTPMKNETVSFTDLSSGFATSWTWSFDRPGVVFVNGTSSGSKNPNVQFTDGGPYTVTLVAQSLFLTDTEVKAGYIRAGVSGLWTGATSSDWNVTTNWDNWLIPGSGTDVVIPPSALNWPVISNLTLGVHCHNLTLSGATSKLTVNGDIVLQ